jgi:hypothetical protein
MYKERGRASTSTHTLLKSLSSSPLVLFYLFSSFGVRQEALLESLNLGAFLV